MRNLLALLALVVIAFAAIGYHQGWYTLNVTRTSDGNLKVETNLDTTKAVQETGDAIKSVGSAIGNQLDKAGQDAKAGQPPTPATTPAPAKQDGVYLFGLDLTPKSGK
jgi:hypothetical protein